jgi:glutamate dehydrogenase/leucine dehydrogenase
MFECIDDVDALGPEKVVHVYDPATGMKGVVVIDCTAFGGMSGGGIRMLPDITTEEIRALARAMTYKFSAVDFFMGGAKSGICSHPGVSGEERVTLMRSFGQAIKPLLQSGLVIGADIGTDAHDLAAIHDGAEIPFSYSGLSSQEKDGEPLENHATGYGAVVAARAACEFAGLALKGATAAVEGFGKAGGGVVRYLDQAGAKVAAVSTIHGAIYNPDGLDVHGLLEARKTLGDRAVSEYRDAEHLDLGRLFTLSVDVLVPGARPYVIDKDTAATVNAKVISSVANIPITDEAEEVLFRRGVHVVPDFISNSGGVIIAAVDLMGGEANDVFRVLEDVIFSLTRAILADARREGINPRALAVRRATEKVLAARRAETPQSLDELLEAARKRFKL